MYRLLACALLVSFCSPCFGQDKKPSPIPSNSDAILVQKGDTLEVVVQMSLKVSVEAPVVGVAFTKDRYFVCLSLKTGKLVLYDLRKDKKLWTVDCPASQYIDFLSTKEEKGLKSDQAVIIVRREDGMVVQIHAVSNGALLKKRGD